MKIKDYEEWREIILHHYAGKPRVSHLTLIYHNLNHYERYIKDLNVWMEFEQQFNNLKNINTKNDALLHLKNENERVRELCKYIINGEIQVNGE